MTSSVTLLTLDFHKTPHISNQALLLAERTKTAQSCYEAYKAKHPDQTILIDSDWHSTGEILARVFIADTRGVKSKVMFCIYFWTGNATAVQYSTVALPLPRQDMSEPTRDDLHVSDIEQLVILDGIPW